MLYEFKSRATGTVTMTESVGRKIVEVMGKTPGAQGIITVTQLPAAIAALKAAAQRDRLAGKQPDDGEAEDDDSEHMSNVGLAQRALPLIEMMEQAHAAGKDVTWGV